MCESMDTGLGIVREMFKMPDPNSKDLFDSTTGGIMLSLIELHARMTDLYAKATAMPFALWLDGLEGEKDKSAANTIFSAIRKGCPSFEIEDIPILPGDIKTILKDKDAITEFDRLWEVYRLRVLEKREYIPSEAGITVSTEYAMRVIWLDTNAATIRQHKDRLSADSTTRTHNAVSATQLTVEGRQASRAEVVRRTTVYGPWTTVLG